MNKVLFAAGLEGATRIVDGPWAVYTNSLLFKAGDYPDKQFAMSAAELSEAATAFQPVGGNIEHSDFLSGRAATVRKAWVDADGVTLRGEVAIPFALDELLTPQERGLSCEWDRATKSLTGIALTRSPRVTDAALMSAYATFAARHDTPHGQYAMQAMHDESCRHGATCSAQNANMASRHEASAIQQMHDTAVEHGAKCATTDGKPSYFNAGNGERKKQMPTFLERATAFFTGRGIPADKEISEAEFTTVLKDAVTPPEKSPEIKALEDRIAQMSTDTRLKDGKAFADQMVAERRILPKDHAIVAAAYFQAATDDVSYPAKVTFGATSEGQPIQGTRVDQLKALFASRTPHVLTEELLREQMGSDASGVMALFTKVTTPDPAAEPAKFSTPGRSKEALLAMSPLGATIVADGKGK